PSTTLFRSDATIAAIPRVLMTAAPAQGDARSFQSAGFAGYLGKPARQGVLAEMLERILARSPAERQAIVTRHTLLDGHAGPQVPAAIEPRFEGTRVLLAEDNAVNQKVAMHKLGRIGCEVELAVNGHEAIRLARERAFDLVFMDVHMPEMDGLEASAAIRAAEAGGR